MDAMSMIPVNSSSGWDWEQYTYTVSEQLVNLTLDYNKDISDLCSGMLSALLKDGDSLEYKFSSIRDLSVQRRLKYLTDKYELLNGCNMEDIISVKTVPVYCNACGSSAHKVTYFGVGTVSVMTRYVGGCFQ